MMKKIDSYMVVISTIIKTDIMLENSRNNNESMEQQYLMDEIEDVDGNIDIQKMLKIIENLKNEK